MKKKKDYLKNAMKIHSTMYNLVACILFSGTSVYYDNINSLFSPTYIMSCLTGIFLQYHLKVLGNWKLEKRTFDKCSLYHSTIKAMVAHKRFCKGRENLNCDDEEPSEDEEDKMWISDDD